MTRTVPATAIKIPPAEGIYTRDVHQNPFRNLLTGVPVRAHREGVRNVGGFLLTPVLLYDGHMILQPMRWFVLLSVLMTVMISGGCASEPKVPAGPEDLLIRQVYPVPGFSGEELFEGAKGWMATSFSRSLDVIRYANRQEGTVIGKTAIPYVRPSRFGADRYDLRFTLIIETKDNRIRSTFRDIYLFGDYGREVPLKDDMTVIRPRLERAVEALIASFSRMEQDENW